MKKKNGTKKRNSNKNRSNWDLNYIFYIVENHQGTMAKMGYSILWNSNRRIGNINGDSLSFGNIDVVKIKWLNTADEAVAKQKEQNFFDMFKEFRDEHEKFIFNDKMKRKVEEIFVMDEKENRLCCDYNKMLNKPSKEIFIAGQNGMFPYYNFHTHEWGFKDSTLLESNDSHYDREEDISPKDAINLLSRNSRNRPVKPGRVAQYQREIRNDEFFSTPGSIAFGVSGELYDGQHRLKSIRDGGKTVRQMISYNWESYVYYLIDKGAPKSDFDTFSHETKVSKDALGTVKFMLETEKFRNPAETEKKEYFKKYHNKAEWMCKKLSIHSSFRRVNVVCGFLKAFIYDTEINNGDGSKIDKAVEHIANLSFNGAGGKILRDLYYAVNNEKENPKTKGARKDYATGTGRHISYRRVAQVLKNYLNNKHVQIRVPANDPFSLNLKANIIEATENVVQGEDIKVQDEVLV